MFITTQKEQYSKAFVRAVAAVAGYKITECDVDDDSIDMGLAGKRGDGGAFVTAPHLELQLKCTETDDGADEKLSHVLKIKNYDDLRDMNVHVPRILVVVCVPADVSNWIHETSEAMVMRRCAYWASLKGAPAAPGETRTVHLPRQQLFNVAALESMMQRIGNGGQP
jgi:hypothetical protein